MPRATISVKRKSWPGPNPGQLQAPGQPVQPNALQGTASSTAPGGPPDPPLAPGSTAGSKSHAVSSPRKSGSQPNTVSHGPGSVEPGSFSSTESPAPASQKLKSNSNR